jgi:hypothetical protein
MSEDSASHVSASSPASPPPVPPPPVLLPDLGEAEYRGYPEDSDYCEKSPEDSESNGEDGLTSASG